MGRGGGKKREKGVKRGARNGFRKRKGKGGRGGVSWGMVRARTVEEGEMGKEKGNGGVGRLVVGR